MKGAKGPWRQVAWVVGELSIGPTYGVDPVQGSIITDSHCYLVMEEKGSFPLVSCVLSQTLTVIL